MHIPARLNLSFAIAIVGSLLLSVSTLLYSINTYSIEASIVSLFLWALLISLLKVYINTEELFRIEKEEHDEEVQRLSEYKQYDIKWEPNRGEM